MILPTYDPEQLPSPRAQELGQKLTLVIAEYQQQHPDVSQEEIRVAASLASGQVTARRGAAPALLAAVVAAAAGLGALLYLERGVPGEVHVPWVVVGVGVIVLAGVFVALGRRS